MQTKEVYNSILDNYCDFIQIGLIRNELGIPKSDKLKKNGTFKRDLYFLSGTEVKYARVKIQTLLWTREDGKKVYISVFPFNIIKYNKVDANLIEFISRNVKEGDNVFDYVNDSVNCLDNEDILVHSCLKVEKACRSRKFTGLLSSRLTEILNLNATVMSFSEYFNLKLRFKEIYLLLKIAENCCFYDVLADCSLSSLNLIFKFLR